MMETKSLLIVGVGGQGTLLASRIMGKAMMAEGYDVKVSEVHGMSQRGGSVITYVRYGGQVHSPVIEAGEADVIVAFEQLEAARYLSFLKPGGSIVTNVQRIDPMPVITGNTAYPEGLTGEIREKGVEVLELDALTLAEKAGSPKAVNVVLIGRTAKLTEIGKEVWLNAVKESVPPKFLELNLKAFELGYDA